MSMRTLPLSAHILILFTAAIGLQVITLDFPDPDSTALYQDTFKQVNVCSIPWQEARDIDMSAL